jgi:predicted TIM-barrel fold metal-dependent hydrolase
VTGLALIDCLGLPATPADQSARIERFTELLKQGEQIPIATHHVLHAGLYSRTITIPAGVYLTGVLVKIPTLVIVNGHCAISEIGVLRGNHVLPACAGRRQAYRAYEDTHVTMIFATSAKTVEEAEAEFTNETEILMSRHGCDNTVVITEV